MTPDAPRDAHPRDARQHFNKRRTDPQGMLAAMSDALRPWHGLIIMATALLIAGDKMVTCFGGRFTTPGAAQTTLDSRVTALERVVDSVAIAGILLRLKAVEEAQRAQEAAQDSATARTARVEGLVRALVRSKCRELDGDARALSVLPCDEAEEAVGRAPIVRPSAWPIRQDRAAPQMPPVPAQPAHHIAAALVPGKRWASSLVRRPGDRIPDPYPEV